MNARKSILLAGGIAAIVVLAIFPLQMSVFALAWPPPETAQAYFDLLRTSPMVGLLSLDVLLMADWIVLLVVWAALYVALRERAPRAMLVTMGIVLVSTVMYFVSNTAFRMLALSRDYSVASGAERESILAAGAAALATFDGPWFVASYVLSGLAVFVASLIMWRAAGWGRIVGGIGMAYGAMQAVPPNLGTVGMVVSVASLLPMLAWLVLVARKLIKLGRAEDARRVLPGMAASP